MARKKNISGLLLVNLGSPDSTAVTDVRRYLREFLMDPRVIDVPYPLRWWIVNIGVLPRRPKQSAHAYESIWTADGSPLVCMSRRVQQLLQARVSYPVELAMRYQNPSIEEGIHRLIERGVNRIVSLPLFPHFAMSSFETAALRVEEVARRLAPGVKVLTAPPFYEAPEYIDALTQSASDYLGQQYDHLLFSFHGIPERHLRKSDPTRKHCLVTSNCCECNCPAVATCYRAQCYRTVKAFVKRAGIEEGKYSVAFQSRLGRAKWLTPYTDKVLEELGQKGKKRLLVMCPAFVADCLETLEEIAMRGKETFLKNGGESFQQIPCLNDHPRWTEALEELVGKVMNAQEEMVECGAV
jgi:ferrochelatase